MIERKNNVRVLFSDEEKTWLTELAQDAGKSIADYLRDTVLSAHAERERRMRDLEHRKVKLTDELQWLWRRIAKGGPLGEALPIENIDHDARVQFGDEIVFTLGEMLTKLREGGIIRRVGPSGRDYESVRKPPPALAKGGK